MKFIFNSNQEFQLKAIKNVVDLFDGIGDYHVQFSLGSEITPNLPEDEDLECHNKAAALLAAIPAARRMTLARQQRGTSV